MQTEQLGGIAKLNYNSFLHVFEYLGLSLLTYRLFSHFQFQKAETKSIIFSFIYGILDEAHQSFTPTRVFSAWDIFLDLAGSLCLLLVLRSERLRKLLRA